MRFRLRTLFIAVTLIAVFLAWLVAQRKWVHDRQEARRWAQQFDRCNIWMASTNEGLPFGLRILRERPMEYFEIDVDQLRVSEMYRVEQLRDLYPEAKIIVKHGGRTRGKEGFVWALLTEVAELARMMKAWVAAARTREDHP